MTEQDLGYEASSSLPSRLNHRSATANQERELREIADRMGCEIVKVYKDHGISGAKGRDKRPGFNAPCRDATRPQFGLIMAWSVDRWAAACKT